MNALFLCSGRVYICNGTLYTLNLTPQILHKLYFPYCDHLEVCGRIRQIDDPSGLTKAECEDITCSFADIGDNFIDICITKKVKLNQFIEEQVKNSDFVIARQGIYGNIGAKFARKYRKPYIYEVVGSTWGAFWSHSLAGKLIAPILEVQVKLEVLKAPYVIYVTQRYLQKKYPSVGVCAGISDVELDCDDNKILEKRLEKIETWKESEPLKLVTIAGINVRNKGHIYVFKALSQLKQEGIIFYYYLIGDGDSSFLRKKAQELGIANQVFFVGALNHQDVFLNLKEMDVYVQMSLHEGLPRSVIEAMSMALPCISSRVAGIPELLGEQGLCKKKSVQELCQILRGMDKKFLKTQAIRNYKQSKQFSNKKLKEKRDCFYYKFLRDTGLLP